MIEKKTFEEILEDANRIMVSGDIFANYSTTIENAKNILDSGLDYNRENYVVHQIKDLIKICVYGKNDIKGDSANIIIELSTNFLQQLQEITYQEYSDWIKNIKDTKGFDSVIRSVTDIKTDGSLLNAHIPREFIRGMFVYCDNTCYSDFVDNEEEAFNHMAYVENEYFFDNLSFEEQEEFVNKMKNKVFGGQENYSEGQPHI